MNHDVGEAWAARWSAHDPEGLAELFADDCVYDDVAFGVLSRGRDGVVGWATGFLASFPDLSVNIVGAFAAGDRTAVEWLMSGTHQGAFDGISATGNRFEVRGVSIIASVDGRIRRCSDYWDLGAVRRQLIDPGAGRAQA